jgi:hypothetical protein
MGYHTEFTGHVTVTPPLNADEIAYLQAFADSRRFHRRSGPYRLDGDNFSGGDTIDYNEAGAPQPGLWCDWTPSGDGTTIAWNGVEKPRYSVEWMIYLINVFLKPGAVVQREMGAKVAGRFYSASFDNFTFDHVLNGCIEAQGENPDDTWTLIVEDNAVRRVEAQRALES